MVEIEGDITESVSRRRRDRCLRSFWCDEHVSMKTVATVVHHAATSDVTQALVNVCTTPALVNAHVTPSTKWQVRVR